MRTTRPAPTPTRLDQRLLTALEITHTSDLVTAVYREPLDRARIAALAPIVLASADDDPDVLPRILEPAAGDLAECVLAVHETLAWDELTLPLGLAGSFLLAATPVRECLLGILRGAGIEPSPVLVPDPVIGAVRLASQALGT